MHSPLNDFRDNILCAVLLADYARYRITLNGITDSAGTPVTENTQAILTALSGDANGDMRVKANDVGGVRSLVGDCPIEASGILEVRSDVNNDGCVDNMDVDLVSTEVGKDARFIPDP